MHTIRKIRTLSKVSFQGFLQPAKITNAWKGGSYIKKDSNDDESDKDSDRKRRKRGRAKKRGVKTNRAVSDLDDSGERRRRKKKREHIRSRRDKSPDDSDENRHKKRKSRKKRRRRSHMSDSDSEKSEDSSLRHKRKSKRPCHHLTMILAMDIMIQGRVGKLRNQKRGGDATMEMMIREAVE